MSDLIKSDYQLTQTAKSYAQDIFDTFKDENGGATFEAEHFADDMRERAWEQADSSEHVIYTHRAIAICCNCDTDDGEDRLGDWSSAPGKPFADADSFADVCTKLAFATLLGAIESELQTLIDDWEPADEPESDDDSDAE